MHKPAEKYRVEKLPEGWVWSRLGDVCSPTKKINPKLEPSREFTYVDISAIDRDLKMVVAPKSVTGESAPAAARQEICTGDVLLSTVRPNLNAVAIAGPELDGQLCTTGICVLRPGPHAVSEYLFLIAQTSRFVSTLTELTSGSTYPKVAEKDVLDVMIPLPPLAVQKDYSRTMNLVSEIKASLQSKHEAIAAIPNSLMNAAIAGGW